jgi:hypothetical protein
MGWCPARKPIQLELKGRAQRSMIAVVQDINSFWNTGLKLMGLQFSSKEMSPGFGIKVTMTVPQSGTGRP